MKNNDAFSKLVLGKKVKIPNHSNINRIGEVVYINGNFVLLEYIKEDAPNKRGIYRESFTKNDFNTKVITMGGIF